MAFKPIPIGVENFKRLIDDGYYYIDKTLMIKDVIESKGMVKLFTRPRRFGKTLNMSMIQHYFEKTDEDNSYLFEGLNISKAGEKYKSYMGQYPVITLSLKSMKQKSFEDAFFLYKKMISDEFDRHSYVLDSDKISDEDKEEFRLIRGRKAEDKLYNASLKFLCQCLKKCHGKNTIILIDEYDVPLESAYFGGFYDEMVNLIRSVFESALETNDSLEFGILTSCLRISKESIFTGLNNLSVYSITENLFSQYYGFTEDEVKGITDFYQISEHFTELKDWYDGYRFGETDIYNPWSILNFLMSATSSTQVLPKPYWSNTSSNDIIRELIFNGGEETKSIIQELMNGKSIKKPIYEDITYRNVDINTDYIWSFLLFTGYLKQINSYLDGVTVYSEMVIPNKEIQSIYANTIMQWFKERVRTDGTADLFEAIISGDTEAFEDKVNEWLLETISYYDSHENYYHGFLTGLITGRKGYLVKSNRESGLGRSDIMICEHQKRRLAVIIEVKVAGKFSELDMKCDEALRQIEEKNYEAELIEECYQNIIKYGVAFHQKTVRIKKK